MTIRLGLLGVVLLVTMPALAGVWAADSVQLSWSNRNDPMPLSPPKLQLEALPESVRAAIKTVQEHPCLTAKGPAETFNADPNVYRWLLEHPELGVRMWRQLGARVTDIYEQSPGVYRWQDDHGSDLHWYTVYRGPGLHVWYAEGKVKPNLLVPLTPFRCVVMLRYLEGKDATGKSAIKHQAYFQLHCERGLLALATRLLGASAPRLTEQYLGQLQMFYGGLAWYLGQDEQHAKTLYQKVGLIQATPTMP
jgi:hypothetical protein